MVLLADANAQLGSAVSEAVGPVNASVEDPPGRCLHEMLVDRGLFAPCTFIAEQGDGDTWTSPCGAFTRRLDYVIMPGAWRHIVKRAYVDRGIDRSLHPQA